MRIVTWNMGRKARTHAAAWRYLLDSLEPHIALVQEALVAADELVRDYGSIAWYRSRPGGTGVFIRNGIEFETIPVSIAGSYAAGVAVDVHGEPLHIVSVHVGPENWDNQEALLTWFVDQASRSPALVGGDLNVSRTYSARHAAYLARLSDAGWSDCHWLRHNKETPSFWGQQSSKVQYQNDHFFLSQKSRLRAHDCYVVGEDAVRALSDHGPVVLDLT